LVLVFLLNRLVRICARFELAFYLDRRGAAAPPLSGKSKRIDHDHSLLLPVDANSPEMPLFTYLLCDVAIPSG
jgi:hypothetical protein